MGGRAVLSPPTFACPVRFPSSFVMPLFPHILASTTAEYVLLHTGKESFKASICSYFGHGLNTVCFAASCMDCIRQSMQQFMQEFSFLNHVVESSGWSNHEERDIQNQVDRYRPFSICCMLLVVAMDANLKKRNEVIC